MKQTRDEIRIFGTPVPTPEGVKVWNSGRSYLRFHGLGSYWFAESATALDGRAFAALVAGLPAVGTDQIPNPFSLLVFVEGTSERSVNVGAEDIRGFAIYSLEDEGVACRFYRQSSRGSAFQHLAELDATGGSLVTSEELSLLHFASFPQVPADSGMYFLRKALTAGEGEALAALSKGAARVAQDDAICGNGQLNSGAVFLQKPPVPDSCGAPCTGPGGTLMYCALEPWTGLRYCKLADETCKSNELALVLANQAPSGEVPASATRLLGHLTSFRVLRDSVLRATPVGRKYVGYYRLLSRQLELDVVTVKRLAAALPRIYKAVDALVYDIGDDVVVVPPALRDKAIAILDTLVDGAQRPVQQMVADVRQDLANSTGLTKRQFLNYLRHEPIGKREA